MMTAAVLLMIPYFAYVFAFLDPERIVARLQEQSLAEALGRGRGGELGHAPAAGARRASSSSPTWR